jgi:hypothetical protein
VSWLGDDMNPTWKSQWNLHSVWDEGIIDSTWARNKLGEMDEDGYLRFLSLPAAGSRQVQEIQRGDVLAWVHESYALAITNGYGKLPIFDPAYEYSTSRGKQFGGYRLGLDYYTANAPVVNEQLKKGGIRLAAFLNDIFKDGRAE